MIEVAHDYKPPKEPKEQALFYDLMIKALAFLRLKDHNRVQILLSGNLLAPSFQHHPIHGSCLVRLQISTVQAVIGRVDQRFPYCEWRIASAKAAASGKQDHFGLLEDAVRAFLDKHFGNEHWCDINGMKVRMILREPLGVFGMLEGDSNNIAQMPQPGYRETGAIKPACGEDMRLLRIDDFQTMLL